MTGIDITLDGETYTLTSQKDGKERTWLCEEAEIEIGDLQDALEALTAEEFTSEKAAGQQEISLTNRNSRSRCTAATAANVWPSLTERASPMSRAARW